MCSHFSPPFEKIVLKYLSFHWISTLLRKILMIISRVLIQQCELFACTYNGSFLFNICFATFIQIFKKSNRNQLWLKGVYTLVCIDFAHRLHGWLARTWYSAQRPSQGFRYCVKFLVWIYFIQHHEWSLIACYLLRNERMEYHIQIIPFQTKILKPGETENK